MSKTNLRKKGKVPNSTYPESVGLTNEELRFISHRLNLSTGKFCSTYKRYLVEVGTGLDEECRISQYCKLCGENPHCKKIIHNIAGKLFKSGVREGIADERFGHLKPRGEAV